MIYLSLHCGRPEVLQGDSSFEVLQGYALACPRWLTLGCKCTRTLKHGRGQETPHTSGLEGSVAPLKCHFVRPSQRVICFTFLLVSFTRRRNSFSYWEMNDEKGKSVFFRWLEQSQEKTSLTWMSQVNGSQPNKYQMNVVSNERGLKRMVSNELVTNEEVSIICTPLYNIPLSAV